MLPLYCSTIASFYSTNAVCLSTISYIFCSANFSLYFNVRFLAMTCFSNYCLSSASSSSPSFSFNYASSSFYSSSFFSSSASILRPYSLLTSTYCSNNLVASSDVFFSSFSAVSCACCYIRFASFCFAMSMTRSRNRLLLLN